MELDSCFIYQHRYQLRITVLLLAIVTITLSMGLWNSYASQNIAVKPCFLSGGLYIANWSPAPLIHCAKVSLQI